MAESSIIISLTQLCDLALNTSDVGAVNFNILRGLLQVMIKQLGLVETKVEYRGADSEKIQSYLSNVKPGTLTLTEYSVTSEKKEGAPAAEGQVILIQTAAGPEPQFTVTMTRDHFDDLEKKLKDLESQIKELKELPGTLKLLESVKEGSNTPVLDMFQILSIQKRTEAVEQSMEKVATMIESVLKGGSGEAKSGGADVAVDSEVIKQIMPRIERLEQGFGKLDPKLAKGGKPDMDSDSLQNLKDDVEMIKDMVNNIQAQQTQDETGSKADESIETKVTNLELKYVDFEDQIKSLDTGFSRLTATMQEKISEMEKELGEILEKVSVNQPQNFEGIEVSGDLQNQLQTIQQEVEYMIDTIKKLKEESSGKEHTMDILVEQIELLKTIKADREDLEDALANKADACQINRKVSYEQFDQACGDMSKTLEEALTKLTQQEQLWTQALTNIQAEVGTKMDKNELSPLRDFINNKLTALQEKFKALTAMKKEQEAAGTKTRFLRNVNCISCDNDVIMQKKLDVTHTPQPYALPPSKNMGPYLAYELDQIRKHQKTTSKNLCAYENAILTNRPGKAQEHLCTRYCGGSHTVTTPHQRVTRVGHFLEQWGPEIGPCNETQIRGTDGKIYKGRDEEELKKLTAENAPAEAEQSQSKADAVTETPQAAKK